MDSYFEDRDFTMQLHKKHVDSKAKCFWKDCRNRIHPDQLFCSKSCQNKSFSWTGYSRMHQTALKSFNPDPVWMAAPLIDGGLWHTRINPVQAKARHHAIEWNLNWATIFQRYGVVKPVPPKQWGLDNVDSFALASLPIKKTVAPWADSWNARNAQALSWAIPAHKRKAGPFG